MEASGGNKHIWMLPENRNMDQKFYRKTPKKTPTKCGCKTLPSAKIPQKNVGSTLKNESSGYPKNLVWNLDHHRSPHKNERFNRFNTFRIISNHFDFPTGPKNSPGAALPIFIGSSFQVLKLSKGTSIRARISAMERPSASCGCRTSIWVIESWWKNQDFLYQKYEENKQHEICDHMTNPMYIVSRNPIVPRKSLKIGPNPQYQAPEAANSPGSSWRAMGVSSLILSKTSCTASRRERTSK